MVSANLNATARVYRISVRVAVAALLMGAAAYEAFLSTPRETAWFDVAFSLDSAIIAFEAALGGWLFTGVYPGLCWLAAAAAFVGMAVINVVSIATGESSCGCFGIIDVPPTVSLLCEALVVYFLRTIVEWPIVPSALHRFISVGGVGPTWTSHGARTQCGTIPVHLSACDRVWCHSAID